MVFNANLPGRETVTAVVAWTVILSILVHGLTASPLAASFARHAGKAEAAAGG
jgi:NhaP-type Na+/H+ or K+/H+ antiporter